MQHISLAPVVGHPLVRLTEYMGWPRAAGPRERPTTKASAAKKTAQKELTQGNSDNMFFVFNSDVICNYPLKELVEFHKNSGG